MTFSILKRTARLGALTGALLVACSGGNKPPATSSSSGGTDSSDAATSPPTSDTPDAGSTPPVASSDSDGGSSAKPPTTATPKQDEDECVPVAVDFEKRARPKLKECYREGKKKDADLKGTVKIKVTIDMKGKIKATKVIEKTLPDPVADCMLKVVKGTAFPEVEKCWDRTLTIPITFPTPP